VKLLGRWHPINPEPDPAGEIVILTDETRAIRLAYRPIDEPMTDPAAQARRYTDHRRVCLLGPGPRNRIIDVHDMIGRPW
jgi:hypothetical protein